MFNRRFSNFKFELSQRGLLILLAINLILLVALAWPAFIGRKAQVAPSPLAPSAAASTSQPSPRVVVQASLTATLLLQASSTPSAAPVVPSPSSLSFQGNGLLVLALSDRGYTHLFAYQPDTLPFTRLTDAAWDERDPAISPDGRQVAFTSRANGYWDVFTLDLLTSQQTRLTDTGDYDASPAWSADGQWLAFSTCQAGHFQIAILPSTPTGQPPTLLTYNESSNRSPAWSPSGRRIAFIAAQDGQESLWLADLQGSTPVFTRLTHPLPTRLDHPAWSPDGSTLAWGQVDEHEAAVYRLHLTDPAAVPARFASGDWPLWSPDGTLLSARIPAPNRASLVFYRVADGLPVRPAELLPAPVAGLDWHAASLPDPLPAAFASAAAQQYQPPAAVLPLQQARAGLVAIEDVAAPVASLHEAAVPSFNALRQRLANELGWDYLASLENAFTPLTSPLPPGLEGDWLFTGRAIAANTLPASAGWLVAVREPFAGETYWRIFLKTRYQDGSQGAPLAALPWDLNARFSGDPAVYEQGGTLARALPAGYWVDFTDLAARYGWERLPALANWRTYYPAARLTEFVYRQGLDWSSAMLELYPPEVLVTATPARYPLVTPTPVPTWYRTRTATPLPIPTITPTRRPTWTPPA